MTESELSALFDAHDALVTAYVDSSLTFPEFLAAYGNFPHNYALDGYAGTVHDVLQFFTRRMAFHMRVSAVLSGLRSADDPVDIPYADAGRFLPAVGLMRLRELAARYPDFKADANFGSSFRAANPRE